MPVEVKLVGIQGLVGVEMALQRMLARDTYGDMICACTRRQILNGLTYLGEGFRGNPERILVNAFMAALK
jgi:hypothetical protein